MIRKNLLFCKLGLNNNAFDLYTKEMDHYTPQNEICPTCGAKGCCKIHGHYRRSITDRMQDRAIDHPVDIVRVRCKSCGHTHSILPDGFIPYDPYSLPFILHILMRYFSHEMTIQLICARFRFLFLHSTDGFISSTDTGRNGLAYSALHQHLLLAFFTISLI